MRAAARCQVLHQHVGLGQELVRTWAAASCFTSRLRLSLERLVQTKCEAAVDPLVVAAGEVAGTGPLDLDHPCAEVGQLARAERRGDGVLEADHGDAIEWAGFDLGVVHVRFLQIRRRVEIAEAISTRLFEPLGLWRHIGG